MSVRATSIEASRSIHDSGIAAGQYGQVMQAVREAHREGQSDITRREISKATGLETSSVAGRVNKLVECGALVEREPRKCSITGRNVIPVSVPNSED